MAISLTPSRRKRIRRSSAAGIAWMVDKEHYWSNEALREILKRVEALCHEDTQQAVEAGKSALEILERRMVSPAPALKALTLSMYASTLRIDGRFKEALGVYEKALATEGIGHIAQSDLYYRRSVTLICLDRVDLGLQSIEAALALCPHQPSFLATRGWIHMVCGDFPESFRDCVAVLSRASRLPPRDLSVFAAIVNATACLSFEASLEVPDDGLELILRSVHRFRAEIPKCGSSFYNFQRIRHMLSRAEALILARRGNIDRAISMLQRAVEGLEEGFPDDALDACVDLMCLLAKDGRAEEAADEAHRAVKLTEDSKLKPTRVAMNVLRNTAQQRSLSPMQAAEIRVRLRSRDQPVGTWRRQHVA